VRQLGLAPGVVGAPCVADGQCATGRCASAESPIGFCTAECGEGAGCPHGAACGGDGLCGPPVAATSGCAVGGPAAPPAGLLALALLALLRRRRIIA
jgi:MYXO-CTERM domain-containing protein